MRGPARMSNAKVALTRYRLQTRGKLRHLADRAAHTKPAFFIHHRQASGVVTAIFEPAQSFEKDRRNVIARDGADYAAHKVIKP